MAENMPDPTPLPEPSVRPEEGWHAVHLYYRIRRDQLALLSDSDRRLGCEQFEQLLDPKADHAPPVLQTFAVAGHKADFGMLLLGPDPLQIDSLKQKLQASALGPALEPTYSYVSLTEVSEYVPTVEQYAERLQAEGDDPDSEVFQTKLKAYEAREGKMRQQRLYPVPPPWPIMCFYPMSKKREVGENWYMLDSADRMRMMAKHGRLGQTFAGKVSQLITGSTGLDDWEWGVTLWVRRPEFLKEVVYTMRFDEASARYAQFGPFYFGYVLEARALLEHLRLT